MHKQNVKTAASESTGRWGERIARIIDSGHHNVACAQEAHEHYGDKYTRTDACVYFIRGALSEMFKKA